MVRHIDGFSFYLLAEELMLEFKEKENEELR
jgi:hypothetical protein